MSTHWSFMRNFTIGNADQGTYLHRLRIVRTPWFGLYLHRFERPDSEPDMHDHPWSFRTWVLRGGYTEMWTDAEWTTTVNRTWHRWSTHRISHREAHSIVEIEPKTTTLVLTGREVQEWGFWTPDGWVAWQTYLAALGTDTTAATS